MEFNYKDGQLKTKYERKIKELNELDDKSKIDDFITIALAEVKEIKNYKNTILDSFKKRVFVFVVLADILLILGIALLIVGFYNSVKSNTGIPFIVIGGFLLLLAAVFFGLAEYNRDKKRKFLSDIISDSEIIEVKELINEFSKKNK